MKLIVSLVAFTVLAAPSASTAPASSPCADPLAATVGIMDCIKNSDIQCTWAGYDKNFKKYHNGVDTKTKAQNRFYWGQAFKLVNLALNYSDQRNMETFNQCYIKYIETVTFKDGVVMYQHEAATVTVNNQCQILTWNQTGIDKEQTAVTEYTKKVCGWICYIFGV
jgi:hypothetical protein